MLPKVAIIILNFNGWADTLECLASLNRLDYSNFEIILIDNASKERPPLVNVQFLKLTIFQVFNEKNLGFAGGNNQGIKIALERGADYVLLLNNDTTVEPDFLKKLVEAGENNKSYGIFGPVIYYSDEPEKIWFAGGQFNWSKTQGSHLFANPSEELKRVDYVTGCCLLAKKEIIEKIGLLSEDYFLYYEDGDWCLRSQKAGYSCGLVGSAKIYHKQSRSAQEFSYPYIYYHSRNGLIFSSRHGLKPLTYLISLWIFFKQLIKVMIDHNFHWAGPVMRGVADFWRGKRGKLEGYY
jgi:hypothetical protein